MTKNFARKERTLESLREALSRLVNGNPNRVRPGYRISVNAVCAEAGITRQGFYKSYRSFEDDVKARPAPSAVRR